MQKKKEILGGEKRQSKKKTLTLDTVDNKEKKRKTDAGRKTGIITEVATVAWDG